MGLSGPVHLFRAGDSKIENFYFAVGCNAYVRGLDVSV